ncbi:MAG: hypothetical protein JXA43_00855 [Candidatus Diapherotrites archaeon]|nr:hypothetical protein [Candidatus Diapherotrites archaeon]
MDEEQTHDDIVRTGFRGGYRQHPAQIIALAAGLAILVMIIMVAVLVLSLKSENHDGETLVTSCGVCAAYERCNEETGKCELIPGRCYTDKDCKFNELCEKLIHQCTPVF